MAYLVKDDYTLHIALEHLDQVLKQAIKGSTLTPPQILQRTEGVAESEVISYLLGKYLIEDELAIDGSVDPDGRNKFIMRCMIDISLYHLFLSVNPRDVPESRQVQYDYAVSMLDKYRNEELNFGLPIVDLDGDGVEDVLRINLSSNRKFISRPFSDARLLDDEL